MPCPSSASTACMPPSWPRRCHLFLGLLSLHPGKVLVVDVLRHRDLDVEFGGSGHQVTRSPRRSPNGHHLWLTLLTCLAPDNIRSFTTLYEMVLSNLENTFLSFSSPRLSPKFLMKTLPTPLLLREGSRWLHMILMLVQYLVNVCFLDWDQFLQNLLLALLADVLSPDSLEGFHAAGVSM